MIAGGAKLVKAQTPSDWEEYANCPALHHLPIVTFKLGIGPSSVTVSLLPEDYILTLLSGNCLLQIADSELDGARILGMNILSKMMTVFDHTNDRLGFCITRS